MVQFECVTADQSYPAFSRVSSDCLPWPAGGVLGTCSGCGALVVRADAQWTSDCEQIYRGYQIYHQSGGAEQVVAQTAASEPAGRSRVLLEKMHAALPVPAQGRLLDVGCGNGGFLRSFTERFPEWTAVGSEFDAKHRQEIESIPGVEKLHVGPLTKLEGGFDLISLIHVLEHIRDPSTLLRDLERLLRPGGRLFIQLPYYVQNPVELLIADHATHFSGPSLQQLLQRCGWRPRVITSDWVAKELSCVAEPGADAACDSVGAVAEEDMRLPGAAVAWIGGFR
ncbi:MAG: class I SAM-dependent methyltransferase, partial [Chitinophagaceae bacterium]|nr:class I SAM-dependent methyltransferase [Chitinophagaceae bacterium]